LPESRRIVVSMANGRIYAVDAAIRSEKQSQGALASYAPTQDGVAAVKFSGKWAIAQLDRSGAGQGQAEAADELLLAPLDDLDAAPHPIVLPDSLAAEPTSFAGGLLVPLRIGQVLLVDGASGAPLAAPFQPKINPSRVPDWTAPVAIADGDVFVIADRNRAVYLVAIKSDPARLTSTHESAAFESPIVGELCATSSSVFAATADRRLVALALPDLSQRKVIELGQEIAWGPFAAADFVLLATDDDRLHCLLHDGSVVAQTSISAIPVGRPISLNGQTLAVALGDGTLLGVAAGAKSVGTLGAVHEPLAAGPVLLEDHLYAATPDGALVSLAVDAPVMIAAAADSD
jgi:hypothetical protein